MKKIAQQRKFLDKAYQALNLKGKGMLASDPQQKELFDFVSEIDKDSRNELLSGMNNQNILKNLSQARTFYDMDNYLKSNSYIMAIVNSLLKVRDLQMQIPEKFNQLTLSDISRSKFEESNGDADLLKENLKKLKSQSSFRPNPIIKTAGIFDWFSSANLYKILHRDRWKNLFSNETIISDTDKIITFLSKHVDTILSLLDRASDALKKYNLTQYRDISNQIVKTITLLNTGVQEYVSKSFEPFMKRALPENVSKVVVQAVDKMAQDGAESAPKITPENPPDNIKEESPSSDDQAEEQPSEQNVEKALTVPKDEAKPEDKPESEPEAKPDANPESDNKGPKHGGRLRISDASKEQLIDKFSNRSSELKSLFDMIIETKSIDKKQLNNIKNGLRYLTSIFNRFKSEFEDVLPLANNVLQLSYLKADSDNYVVISNNDLLQIISSITKDKSQSEPVQETSLQPESSNESTSTTGSQSVQEIVDDNNSPTEEIVNNDSSAESIINNDSKETINSIISEQVANKDIIETSDQIIKAPETSQPPKVTINIDDICKSLFQLKSAFDRQPDGNKTKKIKTNIENDLLELLSGESISDEDTKKITDALNINNIQLDLSSGELILPKDDNKRKENQTVKKEDPKSTESVEPKNDRISKESAEKLLADFNLYLHEKSHYIVHITGTFAKGALQNTIENKLMGVAIDDKIANTYYNIIFGPYKGPANIPKDKSFNDFITKINSNIIDKASAFQVSLLKDRLEKFEKCFDDFKNAILTTLDTNTHEELENAINKAKEAVTSKDDVLAKINSILPLLVKSETKEASHNLVNIKKADSFETLTKVVGQLVELNKFAQASNVIRSSLQSLNKSDYRYKQFVSLLMDINA